MSLPEVTASNTFMYFAYGSNLLSQRIHVQNPTAVRKTIGKLENHRLDFNNYAKRWGGAPATIVADPKHSVWGAVWEIDLSNMDDLDRQEGVPNNVYRPLTVPIVTANGESIMCRTYQLVDNPATDSPPLARQPSQTYLQIIIKGSIESELPDKYHSFLCSIQHNGRMADEKFLATLNLNNNLHCSGA